MCAPARLRKTGPAIANMCAYLHNRGSRRLIPAPIKKRRVFHLTQFQVIFLLSMPPVHCVIVGQLLHREERDIGILERE